MKALRDQAVYAALSGDWELAIELNLQILASSPDDIASLNRLGRAYTELDQKEAAKETYQRVLKIDKYNVIALKNLRLLPHQKSSTFQPTIHEDFIEEPGLTKTTNLVKLAARDILLSLSCRQPLTLTPRGRLVAVSTADGTYIGCLPDDLSLKLKSLLPRGYNYNICIKGATDSEVNVFVREIKRPRRISYPATFSRLIHL